MTVECLKKTVSQAKNSCVFPSKDTVSGACLTLIFALLAPLGCSISITENSDLSWHDPSDTEWDYDDENDAGAGGDSDHMGERDCYRNTTHGCSLLSWSEVEAAVDSVFLSEDFYNGYDQQEALNLARKFYEHGTYPESRLAVVKTQDLGGGRYRAFVTATSDKGFPLTGLMASHFAVTTEAGKSYVATQVKRFGDLSDSEIRVELSAVIDDSGSIQDCDAVQIAGGLSNMFDSLPPVYQAELIKFETDIYRAHGFTENGEAIAQRMMSYCTNRGSTALWDAIDLGMDERLAEPDLKIIVVFSDGIDSSSTSEAAEIVANLKKRRIPVFSVALGLADVVNLWNLSAVTGGGFVYIYSGEDILWAFSLMADFLNEIYIIEWESAVPPSGSTISVQKDDGSVISAKI